MSAIALSLALVQKKDLDYSRNMPANIAYFALPTHLHPPNLPPSPFLFLEDPHRSCQHTSHYFEKEPSPRGKIDEPHPPSILPSLPLTSTHGIDKSQPAEPLRVLLATSPPSPQKKKKAKEYNDPPSPILSYRISYILQFLYSRSRSVYFSFAMGRGREGKRKSSSWCSCPLSVLRGHVDSAF